MALAVHDLGGDGPPLLFAHATGFHGHVWEPLAARLADRFHAFALDLRGHGDSTAPPGHHFAWDGFADDVLAVIDALGLDRPVAVGHSKGAAALLLAEERRPGTFAALWCYEPIVFPLDPPPGPMDDDQLPLIGGALRRRRAFTSREEAYVAYAAKPPLAVLHPDALRAYVEHGFRDEPDGTVALKCAPEDEAQVYRMGSAHAAWAGLDQVACPTTIACGAHTDAIRPTHAQLLAGRLPHGRVHVFDHLGHFGPLEDPRVVADAIAEAFAGTLPDR